MTLGLVRVMVKVMVKVRFRVLKYLGFDPLRHSEPFIWETYQNFQCDGKKWCVNFGGLNSVYTYYVMHD